MLPKNRAKKRPTPTTFNFANMIAIKDTDNNTNKITLGSSKIADPDNLSKGFLSFLPNVNQKSIPHSSLKSFITFLVIITLALFLIYVSTIELEFV